MSTPDLFKVPEQDSPRRKWLKRYGVKTVNFPSVQSGDEDELGIEMFPWYAWIYDDAPGDAKDYNRAGGATEADAISNLAIKKKWRLWNEEGL